jgi:hypothetical protein
LRVSEAQWATDFTKHSVPLSEFVVGGPPKDGIPSIDEPRFVSQAEGDDFLDDGEPVAITFCPLCNSTVAFSRVIDGEAVGFGTTGNLRRSDLVMYDRKTETWWQQLTAEAIVGELTGQTLEVLPSQILSWGGSRPSIQVLRCSRPTPGSIGPTA